MEIDKIECGDCIELMRKLPDNSIDLILTDPPYRNSSGGHNHGTRTKYNQPKGILTSNDGKIFKNNDVSPSIFFHEFARLAANMTHIYVMTSAFHLREFIDEGEKSGLKLQNILVWEKQNCTPSRYYMKNAEFVLMFRKGKAKTINNPGSKTVLCIKNTVGNKLHPTEKPVDLMRHYILNSSDAGDVVLDPFMGCGSTCLAALQEGRHFIGYEIDKEYFDIAERRIEEELNAIRSKRQTDL